LLIEFVESLNLTAFKPKTTTGFDLIVQNHVECVNVAMLAISSKPLSASGVHEEDKRFEISIGGYSGVLVGRMIRFGIRNSVLVLSETVLVLVIDHSL